MGVSRIQNTKKNPLDFASRKAMIQKLFPSVIILPIMDQREDERWSSLVDNTISIPFGEKKTIIYGSRDSFIPHYKGKNGVIELESSLEHNATNIRTEVARETLDSSDFRAGVIYSAFNQRAITYPTVDICVFNRNGEILIARKPNEKLFRFIGGFVDPTDNNFEEAAIREFNEETGGNCTITNLKYITSHRINDWRYSKEESGIMTTLYLGEYSYGLVKPSDDIEELKWVPISNFNNYDYIESNIMEEHRLLMSILINRIREENIIPKIGDE